MTRLSDKVGVVTGAGRGIGRAIALRFAEEGCSLALSDVYLEGIRETARLVESLGARAIASAIDVTQRAEVERMIAEATNQLGSPDILVNNAGIYFATAFDQITDAEWHQMLDTNLTSMFIVSQVVIRQWLARDHGGVIINVGSINSTAASRNGAHYCVSKAGVAAMTRCLALEYAARGIRANCVAPGWTQTRLIEPQMADADVRADVLRHIPMRRIGQPREVADGALFFASDESRYVTGTILYVDGGWILE